MNPPFALDFDNQAVVSVLGQVRRFAENHLRNKELAEDVMQEVSLAALCRRDRFEGLNAFRAWSFAVARNKIADQLRAKYKSPGMLANDSLNEEIERTLFTGEGRWQPEARPHLWKDEQNAYDQIEFWQVFEMCMKVLPPQQATAFMMRELLDLDADEVCHELSISYANFKVLMHRARLRIRACLELKWFDEVES